MLTHRYSTPHNLQIAFHVHVFSYCCCCLHFGIYVTNKYENVTRLLIDASLTERIEIIKHQSKLKGRCSTPVRTACCYKISETPLRLGEFTAKQ